MKFCMYKASMIASLNKLKWMQLFEIKYHIIKKNVSQNNCKSKFLYIHNLCFLLLQELFLKRASSESKIVEKLLRAWCALWSNPSTPRFLGITALVFVNLFLSHQNMWYLSTMLCDNLWLQILFSMTSLNMCSPSTTKCDMYIPQIPFLWLLKIEAFGNNI